jgi:hypothetical protein
MISVTKLTALLALFPESRNSRSNNVTSRYPPGCKTRLHSVMRKVQFSAGGGKRRMTALKKDFGKGKEVDREGWEIWWWLAGRIPGEGRGLLGGKPGE